MNLIISGSQQNGIEENLIRPIAERLLKIINDEGLLNAVLIPLFEGQDEEALYQAIVWSNQYVQNHGESRHLAIHADAGYNATGASGLYYSEAGKEFITPILEAIVNITPWADVGLRQRLDLGELKNTIAIAGIIELSFYDNENELLWMKENTELIAQTLKNGVYAYLGIVQAVDYEKKYTDLLQQYYSMKRDIQDVLNKYL